MSQLHNEILRLGKLQAKALLTKMMKGNNALDDGEVIPIIAAFAKATQEAYPEFEGINEAILDEAFEIFNSFCIAADSENTRPDNLKYFHQLLPKRPKSSQKKT